MEMIETLKSLNEKKMIIKKWVYLIADALIRVVFISLYSYTAVMKIAEFKVYRIKMYKQPFADWFTEVLIYALPAIEIGMATLLILPFFLPNRRLRIVPVINVLLMASFTAYAWMAKEKIFGYIPCACGGIFQDMEWPEHYRVNWILMILAVGGACLQYWPEIRLITINLYNRLFRKSHRAQKVLRN
ncbi:MAG TPA: MauE/DoxX family redox-associated membrane protein [Pseudosphingobacterium sp.]|nr:MauE/DoxX family redox-associated membrane protein [Pseudosphingobacterium sp.]